VTETVADTWSWLVTTNRMLPSLPDRPPIGLDPDKERAVLAAWRR